MFDTEDSKRITFPTTTPETTTAVSQHSAASATEALRSSDSGSDDYSGVPGITRNVDAWFEREVTAIRREAERFGAEWAAGNIPALNDTRTQPLDPEKILAHSCESLWQAWPERAKVHTQGAIDSAAGELVRDVANARAAITEALIAGDELTEAEAKIESIRRSKDTGRRDVKYGALLGHIPFWLLAVVLVLVEFLANHPVFRILFPLSAGLELRMNEVVENLLGTGGWLSGLKLTLLDIFSYVEATALAAISVTVLVVAAKSAGAALRARSTLKEDDYSFAAASIRSLHRQMKTVLLVTGSIAICLLIFLGIARHGAANLVAARLADAKATVVVAQTELDAVIAAGSSREAELSSSDAKIGEARAEVRRQEDRLAFAKTVEKNNFGMFLLNIALVAAGILIGFLSDARDLTETIGEDADIVRLKQKCLSTREYVRRLTEQARSHVLGADAAGARTYSLLSANPLDTLNAKRATLSGIIPTWREANARLRRIDPSNIVAFQQPFLPDFVDISNSVQLRTPETFERTLGELDRLRNEINRVERIVDTPIGLAA